jgi:8-hydroxy-5-deazaflavin:NADPH oxidoreductase
MENQVVSMTVAVLGGTGKEGKGLVYRWAKAGYKVLIGSRSPEKAQNVAHELTTLLGGYASIEGVSNLDAAVRADIVALAVPYSVHRATLESIKSALRDKILIDVTVTLVLPKISTVQMPPAGSAALEAHEILGENSQVTCAFQNISYENLLIDGPVECDVLVSGTSKEARAETLKLVAATGLSGWDAGPIENSMVIEGMTSILIGINKRYGSKTAGFRIVGVQAPANI